MLDRTRRRVAADLGVTVDRLDAALAREERGRQGRARVLAWGRGIEADHAAGRTCGRDGCNVCWRAGRQA
jgi:hypothetical protein